MVREHFWGTGAAKRRLLDRRGSPWVGRPGQSRLERGTESHPGLIPTPLKMERKGPLDDGLWRPQGRWSKILRDGRARVSFWWLTRASRWAC